MRRYPYPYHYFFLFLLVRKCATSIGDLDPLGSEIINESSLFDSSNDNNDILSSLSPDGSGDDKLLFGDLNGALSNLAAEDDTSSSLNLDGGDKLFFGDPDGAGSDFAAADNLLFNLNSQGDTFNSGFLASDDLNLNPNPFLTADTNANNPSNCNANTNNENPQPPSLSRRRNPPRNQPRSTTSNLNTNNNIDFCSSGGSSDVDLELKPSPPPPAPREGYLTPIPFLETDEEIKRFFCPTQLYQEVLNIPVCAIYDDFGLLSSDLLSSSSLLRFVGSHLAGTTRLVDVRIGGLSKFHGLISLLFFHYSLVSLSLSLFRFFCFSFAFQV